jgi:hypothetical protein
VLRLLAEAKKDLDVRRLGRGDYLRYLHACEESWSTVERAFDKIAALAEREDFEVLLVIFPMLDDPWSEYPRADIHARVAEAARARGLEVLDLLEVYSAHDPLDLRVSEENRHPNRLAHALAAEAIRARLAAEPFSIAGGATTSSSRSASGPHAVRRGEERDPRVGSE